MPTPQSNNLTVYTIENKSIQYYKINGIMNISIDNKFLYKYTFDKSNCDTINIIYDSIDRIYYQTLTSNGLVNGIPLKYIDTEISKYINKNKITIKNIDDILLNITNNRITEYDYLTFKTINNNEVSFSYLWNYLNFDLNNLKYDNVFFIGQPIDIVYGNKYFEKRLMKIKENYNNYSLIINNNTTQKNINLHTKLAIDFSFDYNFIYEKYKKTIEVNNLFFFNPYSFSIYIPDENIEIEFKSIFESDIESVLYDDFITSFDIVGYINIYYIDNQNNTRTLIENFNNNIFNFIKFDSNDDKYKLINQTNYIEFSYNNNVYKIDITNILNNYITIKNRIYHTTPTSLNNNSTLSGYFTYGSYDVSSTSSYAYNINKINSVIGLNNTNTIDISGLSNTILDGLDNLSFFLAFDYEYNNQVINIKYYAENTRYEAFYNKDLQFASSNNQTPNNYRKPREAFGVYDDTIFLGDLYNANSYFLFNKFIDVDRSNKTILGLKILIDNLNANFVLSDLSNMNISNINNYNIGFGLSGSIFYPYFNKSKKISYYLTDDKSIIKLISITVKDRFLSFNLITENLISLDNYNKIPAIITSPAYFILDTNYFEKDNQIDRNIFDENGSRKILKPSDFKITSFQFIDFYILFKTNKKYLYYTIFYDEDKKIKIPVDYYNILTTNFLKNSLTLLILKPALKYLNNKLTFDKYTFTISKSLKVIKNTSIETPSLNFNYNILNIYGKNIFNNFIQMNYNEIGSMITVNLDNNTYYSKITTNYNIQLNQTTIDETKSIEDNYIYFVYKKLNTTEYNDIIIIDDDIYISTDKPLNILMTDYYEYDDNISSIQTEGGFSYSGIDYQNNNPINNINSSDIIYTIPNTNFSFDLDVIRITKPINYPYYINYVSSLKSKLLNKQNMNLEPDIFVYQNINERPLYFYDINIPTIDNPPILLKYFPYPFTSDNIKFDKKIEQEFTIKIRFNEKLYKNLLNNVSVDLNNKRVVRKKVYVVNRVGFGSASNSEDNYIVKFSGELVSMSTDGIFIILKVKNMLIDYDRYITNITSDLCPFEFKSMKCGCSNSLAISCNKTYSNCYYNFYQDDSIANKRFGGIKAINYYTKNEYIRRGIM